MATDVLPPPRLIVPFSGHRLAATYDRHKESLVVDELNPENEDQLVRYSGFPDLRRTPEYPKSYSSTSIPTDGSVQRTENGRDMVTMELKYRLQIRKIRRCDGVLWKHQIAGKQGTFAPFVLTTC